MILSCSIIVCEANDFMKPIHERMPVILTPKVYDEWLSSTNSQDMQDLLVPYAGTDIEMYKVSRDVNSPKNDRAELVKRI